jgi:hypothetical protein
MLWLVHELCSATSKRIKPVENDVVRCILDPSLLLLSDVRGLGR